LSNLFTREGSLTYVCALIGLVMLCSVAPSFSGQPSRSEKTERSAAQRKINSQLLYEIYRRRGEAQQKGVPPGSTGVKIDARGRALIDVRAEVTAALQHKIRTYGGTVLSTSRESHSIIARVPLLRLERLAADPSVRFIEPAAEAITVR
jgi:hypothetical protein